MIIKKEDRARKRGFTLTEVLVVVLIIAVLAALVYPLYTKSITKSRAVEAINLLEMVRGKQLQKFARTGEYFEGFSSMGQITSNPSEEQMLSGGAQLKIKDYTLSLNNPTKCMSAQYKKGATNFTFSSSYEHAGLGCTGSICASFGDIVGDAKSVCNCGDKDCQPGFDLNEDTCNCTCALECNQGGKCYGKTQTQVTSKQCGWNNTGTQTRVCTADCNGGTCGDWGSCSGQTCNPATKPSASQGCGSCGTQSRTVDCNGQTGTWSTGSWGTCTGQGSCSPGSSRSCGNNNTGTQVCTSSCGWGTCQGETYICTGAPSQSCGNCGTQTRTCNPSTGTWGAWSACYGQGSCSQGATQSCGGGNGTQTCSSSCGWGSCVCKNGYTWNGSTCVPDQKDCVGSSSQSCGNCGTQTRTCNTATGTWGAWGSCSGEGACSAGTTQSCGGGNGSQTCSSSCGWGSCTCNSGYTWNGSTCVPNQKDCVGAATQACGNCGTQTRTCDRNTGTWSAWGTCTGQGECAPGTSSPCNRVSGVTGGTKKCTSSCRWDYCVGTTKSCCCTGGGGRPGIDGGGSCYPYVPGISSGRCSASLSVCPQLETITWRDK